MHSRSYSAFELPPGHSKFGNILGLPLAHHAFAGLTLLLIAMRVFVATHYRVDSDEPQHLHVVWGWASGLVQYRDVFDNHAPLFQMLCAPLLKALGERADIIIPMRLAMIPLFLTTILLTYRIGAQVIGQSQAWIAAALLALFPTFFFVTAEFRTDDLWAVLWLAAFLIVTLAPIRGWSAFYFGFVMGAALSTSMKTVLLVLSLGLAALCVAVLRRASGEPIDFRDLRNSAALALFGMVLLPGSLTAFFAMHGALPQMIYCIFKHNTVSELGSWRKIGFHHFYFPLSVPLLLWLAWKELRSREGHAGAPRRALLLLTAGFYLSLLLSYWPLVTRQDYMPVIPLGMVIFTPWICGIGACAARFHPLLRYAPACLLLLGEFARCCQLCPYTADDVRPFCHHLANTLRLVDRDQFIMDSKGETIFRKRPFYYVLEGITIERMKQGLIADDIPEVLVKTATCVLHPRRMSDRDYQFINANYLKVATYTMVAGKALGQAPLSAPLRFTTLWPARYQVVCEGGQLQGTLDGQAIQNSQMLPAGPHTLAVSGGEGRIDLVWAQALERGFSPFGKRRG